MEKNTPELIKAPTTEPPTSGPVPESVPLVIEQEKTKKLEPGEIHPAIKERMCNGCGRNNLKFQYHTRAEKCTLLRGGVLLEHLHFDCKVCGASSVEPVKFWIEGRKLEFSVEPPKNAPHLLSEADKAIAEDFCPACKRFDAKSRVHRRHECDDHDEPHFHMTCACGWEWRRPPAWWTLPEELACAFSIDPKLSWWRKNRSTAIGLLRFSVGAALGAGTGLGWIISQLF